MTKQAYCILHEYCIMTNHNYHSTAVLSIPAKRGEHSHEIDNMTMLKLQLKFKNTFLERHKN